MNDVNTSEIEDSGVTGLRALPMGLIAVLVLVAVALLATCQAMDLRGVSGTGALSDLRTTIRTEVPRLAEDRRMDLDWVATLAMLRDGRLSSHFGPGAGEEVELG